MIGNLFLNCCVASCDKQKLHSTLSHFTKVYHQMIALNKEKKKNVPFAQTKACTMIISGNLNNI